MKVLVTGADGFIGKNLRYHLAVRPDVEVVCFTRKNSVEELRKVVPCVDFIFHLAGVNRPRDPQELVIGNVDLTRILVEAVASAAARGSKIPVVFASSTQASLVNSYGCSKQRAEQLLLAALAPLHVPLHIFRLPNVFGKWCKPQYNSVVATFCHCVARGLPVHIHDPAISLTLVYVDDVVRRFLEVMDDANSVPGNEPYRGITPEYTVTVGALAEQIQEFKNSRSTLLVGRVGVGLVRALYATYLSYLRPIDFAYPVPQHSDVRGVFVEMLKTADAGQFSFFTAHPGVTRGGHYHHTKSEKFLVVSGQARFRFRNLESGECYELVTSGGKAEIVETVPGWTHDITNIGKDEMLVILWANEIFDRARPDTFAAAV